MTSSNNLKFLGTMIGPLIVSRHNFAQNNFKIHQGICPLIGGISKVKRLDKMSNALVVYTGAGASGIVDHYSGNSYGDVGMRDENSYVGLSNQGATCYLNSLLQTLFMTPEFRKAIFSWHYDSTIHGPEQLCIPLQLQRLFGQLALGKLRSVDTIALTKSFGWEGSEVFQQQDVQELTRVLFDALEETFKVSSFGFLLLLFLTIFLQGTEVENVIDQLYAGELVDYIRCIDVEYESERRDKFLGSLD